MTYDVFAISWNEGYMVPHFLKHYFEVVGAAHVTIFDNHSDDGSDELAASLGATVVKYDSDGLDDKMYRRIKDKCWKESAADYVIVVDMDEFVLPPEHPTADLYYCNGYQMVSKKEPSLLTPLVSQIKRGVKSPSLCKPALFRPDRVNNINYGFGAHIANPHGHKLRINKQDDSCKLLHYKWIGDWGRIISRQHQYLARLSEFNRSNAFVGAHYRLDDETKIKNAEALYKQARKVI